MNLFSAGQGFWYYNKYWGGVGKTYVPDDFIEFCCKQIRNTISHDIGLRNSFEEVEGKLIYIIFFSFCNYSYYFNNKFLSSVLTRQQLEIKSCFQFYQNNKQHYLKEKNINAHEKYIHSIFQYLFLVRKNNLILCWIFK